MNRFKEIRIKNNLTQTELAEMINVKQRDVSKWETYLTMPNYDNLIKFSKTFNVSTDYLLGLKEETNNLKITEKQKENIELMKQLHEFQQLELRGVLLRLLEEKEVLKQKGII